MSVIAWASPTQPMVTEASCMPGLAQGAGETQGTRTMRSGSEPVTHTVNYCEISTL